MNNHKVFYYWRKGQRTGDGDATMNLPFAFTERRANDIEDILAEEISLDRVILRYVEKIEGDAGNEK